MPILYCRNLCIQLFHIIQLTINFILMDMEMSGSEFLFSSSTLVHAAARHGYITEFTCKSLTTSKTHWCLVFRGCVIRGTTCMATIIYLNFRLTEKHIPTVKISQWIHAQRRWNEPPCSFNITCHDIVVCKRMLSIINAVDVTDS